MEPVISASWTDWSGSFKALGNAGINVLNGITSTVNLGLYNVDMLNRHGGLVYTAVALRNVSDVPRALEGLYTNTYNGVVGAYDYVANTPIETIGTDALNTVGTPEFAEGVYTFFLDRLKIRPGALGRSIPGSGVRKLADNVDDASPAGKQTTVLGENMQERVKPYAEATGSRTIPFGTNSPEVWYSLTPKERWKMNDGALRKRINEGDDFVYIGIDPEIQSSVRTRFDLTRSELLRLEWKGVPYKTVSESEVQATIGKP